MEREVIQLATFLPSLKSGPSSEQRVNCLAGPYLTQSDPEDTAVDGEGHTPFLWPAMQSD